MCFGRMLKICDAKYNGEDWKRLELALGSRKKGRTSHGLGHIDFPGSKYK